MSNLQPAWQGEKKRVTPSSEQVGSNFDPAADIKLVVIILEEFGLEGVFNHKQYGRAGCT